MSVCELRKAASGPLSVRNGVSAVHPSRRRPQPFGSVVRAALECCGHPAGLVWLATNEALLDPSPLKRLTHAAMQHKLEELPLGELNGIGSGAAT